MRPGPFEHKPVHYQYGTEVSNTIHGSDEPFYIPINMPKYLGSMIHESVNNLIWCLVVKIDSHPSWGLFNDENKSYYVTINMIPEADLKNSSFNMIATATTISSHYV